MPMQNEIRQTEVLPIYEMVVAKGGPKITPVESAGSDPDADKNKNFKEIGRSGRASAERSSSPTMIRWIVWRTRFRIR
jgi:uncharacterized protein (TIGR03435 family)